MRNLDILVLFNGIRQYGIDCAEITRVISNINDEKDMKLIDKFGKENNLFDIKYMSRQKPGNELNSFVIVKSEKGQEILVSVPEISNIINTEVKKILVIPEYLRKKQAPFFVWGFIDTDKTLISLITFMYF